MQVRCQREALVVRSPENPHVWESRLNVAARRAKRTRIDEESWKSWALAVQKFEKISNPVAIFYALIRVHGDSRVR